MNMSTAANQEARSQKPTRVTRDEVVRLAYQLWQAAGQPSGRDLEYWLEAEAELLANRHQCPPKVGMAEKCPNPGVPE
jgi:hypothetical protein